MKQDKPSNKSGIYTIENLVNGKLYIGLATSFRSRWSKHLYDLERNDHVNKHLQNAWNKYGDSNIKFEELVECSLDQLCSTEHYWCLMLNTHDRKYGYNIEPTHPHRSKPGMSEESKEKLRKANKGKKMTEEFCRKQSERLKGKPSRKKGIPVSPEALVNYKKTMAVLGYKKRTPEQNEHARKLMTGKKKKKEEHIPRYKSVCQYTLEGELVAEYEYIEAARKAVGASNGEISSVCKYYSGEITEGKRANRRTCKGFIWKYKEE